MNEVIVALIVVCAFGFGVIGTFFFMKKDQELKTAERDLKLRSALATVQQINRQLEKDYAELSSKIKVLNDTSDVDEFNRMHNEVRKFMSFKKPDKA